MTEEEFLLNDRICKIRDMDSQHDLRNKSYVSFSGGKDSCVLHRLVDIALPNNNIPRVFINTGLEYRQIRNFVSEMSKRDGRVKVVNAGQNVKEIWETFGYPMKSKQHSLMLSVYQNSGKTKSVRKYLREEVGTNKVCCPKKFEYQFTDDFGLKVSDKCCTKLKKQTARKFEKDSGLPIGITGIRSAEVGNGLILESALCSLETS